MLLRIRIILLLSALSLISIILPQTAHFHHTNAQQLDDDDGSEQPVWASDEHVNDEVQNSAVGGIVGQVAKTVVYGGASLARWNNRLLCSLFTQETERDNEDQPTLFVFTNELKREKAFRIYAQDEIDQEMIEEAQLDPRQMTYIFVHGWLGGIHNEIWLTEAKNAAIQQQSEQSFLNKLSTTKNKFNNLTSCEYEKSLHRNSISNSTVRLLSQKFARKVLNEAGNFTFKANVIIVEWSDFAHGSLYAATRNSLKVSRRLARLLEQLASVGKLKPQLMHCLGHSIGTHICGQAARLAFPSSQQVALKKNQQSGKSNQLVAQPRFGRITGLDPGGFCYELGVKNESSYPGLRPSDALLVDAYYSNRSPFGNKYQVAQYNVRVNNGFFQRACSVWLNPEFANEYFRAAVRFFFGTHGNNEILTCDHYFATRFAAQTLTVSQKENNNYTCSYVAYSCDSYRSFLRGQCGLCESPAHCYSMDFEYQRRSASVKHALHHIKTHSSSFLPDYANYSNDATLIGAVPYDERRIYYLRVTTDEPYCATLFRLRVYLNSSVLTLRHFRPDLLKVQLIESEEEVKIVKETSSGKFTDSIALHGPWLAPGDDEVRTEAFSRMYGIDNRTLTCMFELNTTRDNQLDIRKVVILYERSQPDRWRQQQVGLVEAAQLDLLSSSDASVRSRFSRHFSGENLKLVYRS